MPDPLDRKDFDRNAPLRLHVAARLAFPDGTITASDLKREAARGRLTIEKISDKEYTTLECVDRMRGLCRLPAADFEHPIKKPVIEGFQNVGIGARLLSRHRAASYCCLSVSGFSEWVKSGRLPPPLPGTSRWDLKAIDRALDGLSGLHDTKDSVTESLALDEWRANRARRSERNP